MWLMYLEIFEYWDRPKDIPLFQLFLQQIEKEDFQK